MLRWLRVRLVLLVVALVGVLALALMLGRQREREAPLSPSPEQACVAIPLEPSCDPALTRVEAAADGRHELDLETSDSRQTLAQEHDSYPFVPGALIVVTIRDESGHPIHHALVRGQRDASDSKPITSSNSEGVIRLLAKHATASVVISAPGFRTHRFDSVADNDVLTLSRGIGIEVQVPFSAVKLLPQRLRVILTPKGTVPWYRAPGTTDSWNGPDNDDGELVQPTHEFMRTFGMGEITGMFDETGTARVIVSDPGDYEVRIVLGTLAHVPVSHDLHGATGVESLREVTPDPMPIITVGSHDEGRSFSIAL